jgi:ABC-2 type transport system ATP-binding protein
VREGTGAELKDQIGGAVVEVSVRNADRHRAVQALATLGARPRTGDTGVTAPAPHGAASLHRVLHELEAAGITAEAIGLRKPTLDEVFLALTDDPVRTPVAAEEAV